jgi:hypothetical protein
MDLVASSAIGAIVGGWITYRINVAKARFDLKRDVYFDLLKMFVGGTSFLLAISRGLGTQEFVEFEKWLYSVDLAKLKIEAIGDSEIYTIINRTFNEQAISENKFVYQIKFLKKEGSLEKFFKFIKIFDSREEYLRVQEEISSAIRAELLKPWWKFWKS